MVFYRTRHGTAAQVYIEISLHFHIQRFNSISLAYGILPKSPRYICTVVPYALAYGIGNAFRVTAAQVCKEIWFNFRFNKYNLLRVRQFFPISDNKLNFSFKTFPYLYFKISSEWVPLQFFVNHEGAFCKNSAGWHHICIFCRLIYSGWSGTEWNSFWYHIPYTWLAQVT